ncbi:MAG: hypothetical protein GQ570_13220 [Helicobacteraceae bacterium]|nr:hypothetical protein [Helicobacteraceae bacterium]
MIIQYKCVPQGHQHHFHQKKVICPNEVTNALGVQRYITMHPRLEAGKELQKIMRTLTTTTEKRFTNKLNIWYELHKDFLAEKSLNIKTLKEQFTHQKLVSAYRSLRRNLPYLFTYKKYLDLKINNTINALVPQGHKKRWSIFSNEKTDESSCWF